ncbi:hypothetical protein [Nocardia sp. XZ_19_385]|uniref:hypothetical protein n=1 Tax=Nocardia sp. XZ_19_385 TaxID=2769488 RepID=UPI00188F6546|nr:hypothetical protein [Nocardia sp. XZ_19_385]
MTTLADAVAATGVRVHEHLDPAAEVPRISRAAAQGDVLVLRVNGPVAVEPMRKAVAVVRSAVTTHAHTLHPCGPCAWEAHTPASASDVLLGVLTVFGGSTAVLIHQEHGALEVLPGTYQVRRQREFAGVWRPVTD